MDSILTSISLGLLASASPCIIPLYPGYLAYLSGAGVGEKRKGRYFLGFFVLAGVLTMMLTLGLMIALLSISVGSALSVIIPIADLLVNILGMLLLFDFLIAKTSNQETLLIFKTSFVVCEFIFH